MRPVTLLAVAGLIAAAESVVVPLALTPLPGGEEVPYGWGYVNGAEAPEQVLLWAGRPVLFDLREGVLRWDANGDLRIDAADGAPLAADAVIALPTPLGGAMTPVPALVTAQGSINLRSNGALVGSWNGQRIALVDYRMDGRFDTWGEDQLHRERDGAWSQLGELHRRMLIDGAAWAVEVDHAVPALRLTREDLPLTAAVVAGGDDPPDGMMERTHLRLVSADERLHATLEQAGGPLTLPVGAYTIEYGQLRLGGLIYQTDWSIPNRLTVPQGAPARLVVQAPQRLEATVVGGGDGQLIVENLALATADGLRWRACVKDVMGAKAGGGEYLLATWSVRGAGREHPLGKLDYG